jgi:hypothetical protein
MTTELINQQRDRIAELEREKAALAWQVEALKDWRRLALQFDGHRMQAMCMLKAVAAGSAAIYEVNEFIAKAPVFGTEHLNQIKAEAGVAGLRHGIALAAETGVSLDSVIVDCWCEGYAASIAKGEL